MNGEKKFLTTKDNTKLNLELYESTKDSWLIITYGVGEHLGRHRDYIKELFSSNYNIAFYDLRGHGKSEGKKGWVSDFSLFYSDLSELINYLKVEYKMSSYSLFGHSMGALITAGFIQEMTLSLNPEKVFLNAPPAAIPGVLGSVVNLVKSDWLEKLSENGKGIYLKGLVDLRHLSHDGSIKESYENDDLCLLSLNTALLFKMIKEARKVFSKPFDVQFPVFCSVGSSDKIVSAQTLVEYFSFIEKNVRFKLIEGGYHEVHNDYDAFKKPYFDFLKASLC